MRCCLLMIAVICASQPLWGQAKFQSAAPQKNPAAPAILAPTPGLKQIPVPVPTPPVLRPTTKPEAQTPVPETTAPTATPPAAPKVADRPKVTPLDQPGLLPRVDTEPAKITPDLLRLKQKIEQVLAIYEQRHQNTRDNTNWEVMHAFVAFNSKTQIRRYGPTGVPVNAIGWVLWGQPCNGQTLLTLQNGRPHAEIGVGVQGHPGQLLAILAQSKVSLETPLKIQGREFKLRDLLNEEMRDCRPNTELTFRLMSFSHYLDLNETWQASDGQTWNIPRLISEELKAPIRGAACGGTHRLFGLTYAYQQRIKRGEPLDGEYLKAKQYIENYQRYAWSIMNPDGSFSTQWFWRGENRPDIDRKIQTTGHAMEWLILAQSDEELVSPRMVKSIDFVATHLLANPRHEWKLGPMGHALHSLSMYNERIFNKPKPKSTAIDVVKQPETKPLVDAPRVSLDPDELTTPKTKPVVEKNPFDEDPTNMNDEPEQVPENLAPPKTKQDQGQADESGKADGPQIKSSESNKSESPTEQPEQTRLKIENEPSQIRLLGAEPKSK